ncbi:MAG: DUF4339 domain-containing protein [Bacteroidota bacterium]
MQKYYYNDGVNRYGPFTLEELKAKNISASTPVWYEGLPNWIPAGEVDELKNIFSAATPDAGAAVASVPEETPATATTVTETAVAEKPAEPVPVPVETVSTAAVAATAAPVATATPKKGKPAITWALSLAAIAAAGFFVYQDMEKNKDSSSEKVASDITAVPDTDTAAITKVPPPDNSDSVYPIIIDSVYTDPSEPPMTVTTVTTNADQASAKEAEDKKKKAAEPVKKKAEDEKKKLLAAEIKKKADEKKRQVAAQAAAEKEREMRNNWPRYVTVGSFKVEGDDKVKPFSIPVSNGYPVSIDKVTLRVDYLKKEKVVGTETIILSNIPARGSMDAQAAGNKKGKNANVYITAVTSRQLHLCYPSGGGKAGDPYYCN